MNCQAHREAIIDLARGVAMPAAVLGAAQAHLEHCAACGAVLRRQHDLTAGLRALAAAADAWQAPAGLEDRLHARIATAGPAAPSVRPRPFAGLQWAGVAAAAAAILLAAWMAKREAAGPPITERVQADVPASPRRAALPAARREPPAASPAAGARPKPALVARPRLPDPARDPAEPSGVIEFMAIPGAIGLPALESATIVRTELPVSVLPTYGVDIAPDAARPAVAADLLIGQDGQARGIRLVQPAPDAGDSRSRQ